MRVQIKATAEGAAEEPAAAAAPEVEAIDVGGSLPAVTLKNEKGEDVDVSTLTAEKGLVLFLVPKADTRESARRFAHRSD